MQKHFLLFGFLFLSAFTWIYMTQQLAWQPNVFAAPLLQQPNAQPQIPHTPSIIGGQEAEPGAWPWMVALVHANKVEADLFCGGALIDPNWVLTAAHCTFTGSGQLIQPGGVDVVIGRHALSANDGQRIDVVRIIRHPLYTQRSFDNDIALIELATPAIGKSIGLIDETMPQLEAANRPMMVTGWGVNDDGKVSNVLRQVEVPLVDRETCLESYGIFNGNVTDNMLCAGLIEGGKDSCQGDSGGPLATFDRDAEVWRQVGIVSWGNGCAKPFYYGVYTRISHYDDWVAAQLSQLATPTITPTPTFTATFTATSTPTGTLPATSTPTATATPTLVPTRPPSNVFMPFISYKIFAKLANGNFEAGVEHWREFSLQGEPLILLASDTTVAAHSGSWLVWLGGLNQEVSFVRQRVTISPDAPILQFWYWIISEENCGFDFAGVVVNGKIVDEINLCRATETGGWRSRNVDLRAYTDQTIDLQIRAETDASTQLSSISTWYIDDVGFGTSALPAQLAAATGTAQSRVKPIAGTPHAPQFIGAEEIRLWRSATR